MAIPAGLQLRSMGAQTQQLGTQARAMPALQQLALTHAGGEHVGLLSAGAAASNMDRLSGIISNLKDQATDFYNRIADAGALEYVKGQLKQRLEQQRVEKHMSELRSKATVK